MKSKTVILAILVCGVLLSCRERFEEIEIGSGFYLSLKGAEPLLHAPGNEQLWRKHAGHDGLVWPYVIRSPIVTNDLALFNGGLTDDHEWKGYPALLVFYQSGPVTEVTEGLTRLYSEKENLSYENLKGRYAYVWPSITNGVFTLQGTRKALFRGTNAGSDWIVLSFTTNELLRIVNETKTDGTHQKYRGVDYVIKN